VSSARLPLTAAQLGIWLGQAIDPESPAYCAAEYIELEGQLDVAAFELAHQRALSEAEALHQRFGVGEQGPEQWAADERVVQLLRVDFSSDPQPEQSAQSWMRARLSLPIDLARGPLFESALLCLSPTRHVWLLRAHHIALDGYAFQLVQARVAALLAEPSATAGACVRLADLVAEDERYRHSGALGRDREFWQSRLRASVAPALLPIEPLARATRHARGEPDAALLAAVTDAARALKVDLSSWLNAAVVAWLARELGVSRYTLGVAMAGRLGSVASALPCMAMNIVPLALSWSGSTTFAELVSAARDEQRAARPHQRYRYEELRQDLSGRRPFGVVVNWMPFPSPVFAGLAAEKHPLSAGPVEELAVALTPAPAGLRVDLEANPRAYDADTLARCQRALRETLALVAAEPHARLDSLPAASSVHLALSGVVGEPLTDAEFALLPALVRIAGETPEAIAIEQPGRSPLTYAELLRQVRALAWRLDREGVGWRDRVAVLLPRSFEAVVAQIAVLWVGAAYLPLDPRGPLARTRAVLEDAAPTLIVTDRAHSASEGFRTLSPELPPVDAPSSMLEPVQVASATAAYVIYTSGSTGKPNGVVVSRSALDHFVSAARQRYGFHSGDRVLQFAPLAFDASVEEIMVTLAAGSTLVLRSEAMIDSLQAFLHQVVELRLSVLDLPTAFFHELVQTLDAQQRLPACVRLVIIGGEAALAERVSRFRRYAPPATLLLNTYGPTETTVVCTCAQLAGPGAPEQLGSELPIGAPLPGIAVAVVDADQQPVPVGAVGQLCVMGPTLASGYSGRPELTATRFVRMDRLRGAPRAYLTGDRVRLNREGELVFLGRIDDELKISGYRVNPLEVEAALLALGSVVEAAVIGRQEGGGQLVAFVASRESSPDAAALRAQLAEHVAPAAVPRQIVFLERLPRDANGKIDRSLLRSVAPQPERRLAPPASPLEQQVLGVWREVLELEISDLDADFFALGGHSLLALRVTERLGRVLGRGVPLSILFRHSTPRRLASALAEAPSLATSLTDPLAARVALSALGGAPLLCLPPADGLSWCYLGLARHLEQATLWGLQAPGLRGESPENFDALVAHYLGEAQAIQPHGPYRLLGWSSGGGLAHALAAQLEERGEQVALLALLDAYPSDMWRGKPEPTELDAWVMMLDAEDAASVAARRHLPSRSELLALLKKTGSSLAAFDDATLIRMAEVALASMRTYRTARHTRIRTPITFFRAAERGADAPEPALWEPYCTQLRSVDIAATHLRMCSPAALAAIAPSLVSLL
jgi:amino acid adenylation domain-containing protein